MIGHQSFPICFTLLLALRVLVFLFPGLGLFHHRGLANKSKATGTFLIATHLHTTEVSDHGEQQRRRE